MSTNSSSHLLSRSHWFLEHLPELGAFHVAELQDIIRQNNQLYYNQSDPIITDVEYDQLFSTLKHLEETHGIFDPTSPTKRIDVLLSSQFSKALHLHPLLSLDNTYDTQDILDFDGRIKNILKSTDDISYIIELKFDGLGVALLYENGKLVRALTRWNGVEGEDITANAFQIASIPKQIPITDKIEVRWEVIMPRSVFAQINARQEAAGERMFSNPRNAASWSLRQLDPSITQDRCLQFFAYSFPHLENNATNRSYAQKYLGKNAIDTYWEYTSELARLGFTVSPYSVLCSSITRVAEEIDKQTVNKPNFDFDIDGLVLKVNDLHLWMEVGSTEHHPRWAIAYKFPSLQVKTQVLSIEHSVGRSGIVTPVANLQPVDVGWVVVARVTLHNYEEVERKDIRIGDSVYLVRAGEVIPEIVSVIFETRNGSEVPTLAPTHCPSCGTQLIKEEGKVAVCCPNTLLCGAQIQGRLEFFVSKAGLEIDGLGPRQIALFLESGLISDFASVFHLAQYQDKLLTMEGYKEKAVSNLLISLEKARTQPLWRFLSSLWIPLVGKKAAKLISAYVQRCYQTTYPTSSSYDHQLLLECLLRLSAADLESIHEIGTQWAASFVRFVSEKRDIITRLLASMTIIGEEKNTGEVSDKLSGKNICITGSFDAYSREALIGMIEQNGGAFRGSVSKNLDYLLAGEKAGSKLAQAKKLGITVLDITEFEKLIAS